MISLVLVTVGGLILALNIGKFGRADGYLTVHSPEHQVGFGRILLMWLAGLLAGVGFGLLVR